MSFKTRHPDYTVFIARMSKGVKITKKKILIISLFVVFALPIPIAMLGSLLTSIWFSVSLIKETSFVEMI